MKRRIDGYVLLLLCLMWGLSLLGMLSGKHLVFDLASHFKFQYMLCGVLCAFYFMVSKVYVNAGAAIALIILNGYFIAPLYKTGAPQNLARTPDIKILMNNVLASNSSAEELMHLIRNENPDIVLLLETNRRWVNDLAELKQAYSHTEIEAREDNFGISLYSKIPIENSEIRYFGDSRTPSVVAKIKAETGEFTLIGVHPLPPINQQYYQARNKQLLELAQGARVWEGPLVLAGDLNTAIWSSHYKVLETIGGLNNTRIGFGLAPTWPSFASVLGIPIDHILVSRHFITNEFKVGPHTGSDHRPIIASLSFGRSL